MITINLQGRFGNQLYQYATCRSIAEKLGYNFYINSFENSLIENYFKVEQGIVDGHRSGGQLNDETFNFIIKDKLEYDKFVTNKIDNIKDGCKLIGYYQKVIFFDYNIENIIKWFQPKYSNAILNEILDKYDIDKHYFVHFRGTDYKAWKGAFLDEEYYNDVRNYFDGLKMVVVTDDIPLAKIILSNFDCDIISNNIMSDFELLRRVKYLGISFSTFSLWSAYLNMNYEEIVAPYGMFVGYGLESPYFYPVDKFKYLGKK